MPRWFTYARLNLTLAATWSILVPIAIATHWVYSLLFISVASLYANAATHFAAWRADQEDVA